MAKVTQKQIRDLQPYLEGETPTHRNADGTREWNMHCPFHGDERRSASLNVDKGLYYCFICGGMPVTALIRRRAEWGDPRHANNGNVNLNGQPTDKKIRVISQAMVDGWHSALMSNRGALQWLHERRGLTDDTINKFQIGYQDGRNYTIPVYDSDGELANIRYYNPNPAEGRRKIWGETGYNKPPRLYPLSSLEANPYEILIVAGEWDAMLAIQYGFNAITRTAGENQWDISWGPHFKGKRVYIAQDMDEEGQTGNNKIARSLLPVTQEVYIVKLPYPVLAKHGKDITDLLTDEGPDALKLAMSEAEQYVPRKGARRKATAEIETVSVLDTFDSSRTGTPMRIVVTLKGRKEPGYNVPRKVHLFCSQDAGAKCQGCPLNAMSGEADLEIAPDDPIILSMVESTKPGLAYAINDAFGIPGGKCGRLKHGYEEQQSVDVLFARPALDYTDGADTSPDAAKYKGITITSVGRHDLMANNTVTVVGALHANPYNQRKEFLAHEIAYTETAVDSFNLDDASILLMKRFQAPGDPIKKLAEISRTLSTHVTRIHGRPEMHALMDLTFHSVLSFSFAGELIARGWLDSLIVGDTRTGKSLAAERLIRHYGGGELISCEAASFAGVVGGLQQMGGRDWAITWGVVPINDRRLVVLDEISGLTPEEIAAMSDIRSSGQAKLIKIQQEATWARTRLLWMGNPRNATMQHYTYGVDAIKPLIGNAEDIARFDLAMACTSLDVAAETINQPVGGGELKYTPEACHALLRWAWTRTAEQVVFDQRSEQLVFDLANEMGKRYIEDPPLVQAANIRTKIARVAVALAARLFSTDPSYQKVVVRPEHVRTACQFMNVLYGMPTFGYRERSKEILADRLAAEENKKKIAQYLKGRPLLAKHLRNQGKFRRQDLEELLNVPRDEANGIINTLYEARMIRRYLGDIYVEPTLHSLLREVKI